MVITYEEFDYNKYLQMYPDVNEGILHDRRGISLKDKAWQHWNRHGSKEGRIVFSESTPLKEDGITGKLYENNNINYLKEFGYETDEQNMKKNDMKYINENKHIKPIAVYFPQFHEIEENNHWEKGWTDFTWLQNLDTKNTQELIKPHKDIGYYNLLNYNVRKQQAMLAKSHGIYGFCYYHYWFYGYKKKCIMHKFFEKLLEDNEPNIPFFINWANEPWTRKWNNSQNDVICDQNYNKIPEEVNSHFDFLLPLFKNKNYIKIDNKPVFVIYQIYHIHDYAELFINKFNELAKLNGFNGIYFLQSIGLNHYSSKHEKINKFIDAAYETVPNNSFLSLFEKKIYENNITDCNNFLTQKGIDISYMNEYNKELFIKYNPDFSTLNETQLYNIYINLKNNNSNFRLSKYTSFDDESIYDEALNYTKHIKNQFYGITPGFNNLSRTKNKCKTTQIICKKNNRVTLFKNTFDKQIENTLHLNMDETFIIINAWNEWGEGMCLEPSDLYGYSFLNCIKNVLIDKNQIYNDKKYKCAVLTTYKNRPDDLTKYYENIKSSFYLKNDVHFDFFLLNQDNDLCFNKTKLWNAGINEVIDKYDFYIFNDLDHFATYENNFDYLYSYPNEPTHMSAYVEQFKWMPNGCICNQPKNCICPHFNSTHMFGGVFKINNTDLKKSKGFNNDFVGWGNEDCDIAYRFRTFTNIKHIHGVYNSDLGDNFHRYFSCNNYISNKILMYFSCHNNCFIENNGYHTLDYKINSTSSENDITIMNIDFNYYNNYYLIIDKSNDDEFIKYITNKFNNYLIKPTKILVNPTLFELSKLNKEYGMIIIKDYIKIIGDVSYIVNNSNNNFVLNYRAILNNCYGFDHKSNNYNHVFFSTNLNTFNYENVKKKEDTKSNILDIYQFIKIENCVLNLEHKENECGLITTNVGYYLNTNVNSRLYFNFDFRYLFERVDLNIKDLNYKSTLYFPPVIINEKKSNEFKNSEESGLSANSFGINYCNYKFKHIW